MNLQRVKDVAKVRLLQLIVLVVAFSPAVLVYLWIGPELWNQHSRTALEIWIAFWIAAIGAATGGIIVVMTLEEQL